MSGESEFVMSWFRRYYMESPPPAPERFGRREFGFMFFDRGYVQRHLSFSRASDLHEFLINNTPSHAYYSSAYYNNPAAATMEEKGWLGADLIFDLDADHIRGAQGLPYEEMLSLVKKETVSLVDDFLLGDLGFADSDLRIVFSGGRGYHIHISNQRVMGLKSHERREIVDYLSATDLDMDWVFPEKASFERSFRDARKVHRARLIPSSRSGGWRGKARRAMEALLDAMEGMSAEEVGQRYGLDGVSSALIEGMLSDLYSSRGGKKGRETIIEKGRLEDFSDRRYQVLFMKLVETEMKGTMPAHVDEPVTSDIKRLIRLPSSLHGKTALKVTPLVGDDLKEFEPLDDAIPDLFPSDSVAVRSGSRTTVTMRGERFVIDGEAEVPTYLALFLICRGLAELS